MIKRLGLLTLALPLGLLTPAAPAQTTATDREQPGLAPQPSIVSDDWSIELETQPPRTISVRDRDGRTQWYWYLPYKVINNTGEDRLFVPEVVVTNDHGEIVTAGRGVPPTVFDAISDRLANPLLESPDDVIGTLLQGEDFARESVAIWPVSSLDVDQFTVFFGGADGETQPLISPRTGEVVMREAVDPITGEPELDENGQPVSRPVMLARTRALVFASPGTGTPATKRATAVRQYEVMR